MRAEAAISSILPHQAGAQAWLCRIVSVADNPAPSSLSDYDELKKFVEESGFFTTPMPINMVGDRIVCASRSDEPGLTGVSFWVAKRRSEWFIATWGGSIYRVPSAVRIESVAVSVLRSERGTPRDLQDDLKSRFSLTPVTAEEFDALSGP